MFIFLDPENLTAVCQWRPFFEANATPPFTTKAFCHTLCGAVWMDFPSSHRRNVCVKEGFGHEVLSARGHLVGPYKTPAVSPRAYNMRGGDLLASDCAEHGHMNVSFSGSVNMGTSQSVH